MGGIGSGRRPGYSGKRATEDSTPLDIRRMARSGALTPGRTSSWEWTVNDLVHSSIRIRAETGMVTLSYTYRPREAAPEVINQFVDVETTPCTLGGSRPWFSCPTCRRRVAVIYGAGRLFACRRCQGLAYASQNESGDDRATRRAGRIRKLLGWPAGILNGPGGKPVGMHWRTYQRLIAEHDAMVSVAFAGMAKRLDSIHSSLDDTRARLDRRR